MLHGKQIVEEHAVFVHRLGANGGHAPVRAQRHLFFAGFEAGGPLVHAQHGVGVADIDYEQHGLIGSLIH